MGETLKMDDGGDPSLMKEEQEKTTGAEKHFTVEERLDRQTKVAAEYALRYYNLTEHVNYKLDVAVNSNGFRRPFKHIIHVYFTATLDDGSAPSDHFFAEINGYGSLEIISCVKFDPDGTDPKISDCCKKCSSNFEKPILHTAGHYLFGQYDDHYYFGEDYVGADADYDDDIG